MPKKVMLGDREVEMLTHEEVQAAHVYETIGEFQLSIIPEAFHPVLKEVALIRDGKFFSMSKVLPAVLLDELTAHPDEPILRFLSEHEVNLVRQAVGQAVGLLV